ncbi:substrate-binding domain-containing protein [Altericista sp. CCNU0014]|uniref:substrate-binding domain-containing protein n=1 Tax=Altericista sp. CCNU0014 TaxID=3082949 RepID=UPI00384E3326
MAKQQQHSRSLYLSIALIMAALGLAYAPIPGTTPQSVIVVSGSELQEPLQKAIQQFQQQHPHIQIALKTQGSLDMVNQFVDRKNDFEPTILIPANGELLKDLEARWQAQNNSAAFYGTPLPIAKTRLVAIAWTERGKALFPDGQFRWERIEQAMQAQTWGNFGGTAAWGSFDFKMTNPARSNSGQLTLGLWLESKLKQSTLSTADLSVPEARSLVSLVKRSVYQPARSSDILLQEFIASGANEADIATDYESIALYRWAQSKTSQSQPYRIYDISPTVETVLTAAIVRQNVAKGTAKAAQTFLDALTQPAYQSILVQYGFRPVNPSVRVETVTGSPWQQSIPGARAKPATTAIPSPALQTLQEIGRLWERAQ